MPATPDMHDDTAPPARAKRTGRAVGEGRQEPPRDLPRSQEARRAKKQGKRGKKGAAATAGRAGASATAGGALAASCPSSPPCKSATGHPTKLPVSGVFVPTGSVWHGITWQDMMGKDEESRKLRFTLLKRGILRGYKSCASLHGAALKQRLLEICESHRIDRITGRKKKDPQWKPPCAKMTARRRRKQP